jgi:SMI1-KNR4 cell-wall
VGTEYLDEAEWILSISRILGIKAKPSARITDLEIQQVERELEVRLPPSYRAFLGAFGAILPSRTGLLGLPRGRLSGDLVLRNYLDHTVRPPGFVKFLEDDSAPCYYLATTLVNVDGECPVVMLDLQQGSRLAARSFLEFLERFGSDRFDGRQMAWPCEISEGVSS